MKIIIENLKYKFLLILPEVKENALGGSIERSPRVSKVKSLHLGHTKDSLSIWSHMCLRGSQITMQYNVVKDWKGGSFCRFYDLILIGLDWGGRTCKCDIYFVTHTGNNVIITCYPKNTQKSNRFFFIQKK